MSDPWLGRTFAGCTLDAVITASSSAHLFRATRERDGQRVSVAVIHPSRHRELAPADQVAATFGKLGADLHPGIPAIHKATFVSGQLVVVMVALQGETLDATVRRGPLSGSALAQLASELGDVLAFLHGRGVIHGGLTPGRVLMTPTGARLLEVGVAPRGRSHVDDMRAFGACLAAAAAGPQAARHLGPISALHPNLPPWLASLIDDCRQGDIHAMPADGLALRERITARLEPILTRSVGGGPPPPPPSVRTAAVAAVSAAPVAAKAAAVQTLAPKPAAPAPTANEELFGRPTDPDGSPPPPRGATAAAYVRQTHVPQSPILQAPSSQAPVPNTPAPQVAPPAPAPAPAPAHAPQAAPEPAAAAPKKGIDFKEAALGLSFGMGSGMVIFGLIYGGMSLLTGDLDFGGSDAPAPAEAAVADAVVPAADADPPAAQDTGTAAEPAPTWPIEVVNGGGQILHLACALDGENLGEEVPLLDGEAWSGDGAMVGTVCSALEPASGEALWTWTADAAADSDFGYALEIPPIPKAEPSPKRGRRQARAEPEPKAAPRPRAAPPPPSEPVEELVKLRIVPGAKRKKKQEGVGVRVDGRRVGNAPVTVDMLDPGGHRIEATWEGKSVKCVITVMAGQVTVSVDPAGGKCAKQ